MKRGYSRETIATNVLFLMRGGIREAEAIRRALCYARASFFLAHPGGALPLRLALPKTHRVREYYNEDGSPRYDIGGPKTLRENAAVRENPIPPSREIAQARRLLESFTGKRAVRVVQAPLTPLPKAGLAFGELLEIGYSSFRDGRPYRHRFGTAASRPLLIASHDGKQLIIFGGRFHFTDRGIEDG